MKKLFVILILSVLLLSSCTASDGGETSGMPDTTAPDVTTDEITTGASETWYLTKQMEVDPKIPEISEEYTALIIKPPLVTEGEQNQIRYKIEFFRDDYKMGELIQVRITLTNLNPVIGVKASYPGSIAVSYFDSRADDGRSSRHISHPMNEAEKNQLYQGVLSYMVLLEFSRENYEREFPLTDIEYGETHVIECAFIADPRFFGESREFTFTVTLDPFCKKTGFCVEFPIEVVNQAP